eukprot:4719185-Prymnesium_polylepis.1
MSRRPILPPHAIGDCATNRGWPMRRHSRHARSRHGRSSTHLWTHRARTCRPLATPRARRNHGRRRPEDAAPARAARTRRLHMPPGRSSGGATHLRRLQPPHAAPSDHLRRARLALGLLAPEEEATFEHAALEHAALAAAALWRLGRVAAARPLVAALARLGSPLAKAEPFRLQPQLLRDAFAHQ